MAAYVGLAETEVAAIVRVIALAPSGAEAVVCTGTLVAANWVLTAAHCEPREEAVFEIRLSRPGRAEVAVPIVRRVRHPRLDLSLLELEAAAGDGVTPLGVAEQLPAQLDGRLVQLGGFRSAAQGAGRSFLVGEVVASSAELLTVTEWGFGGACLGDSGGPALSRSRAGAVNVWGVLSAGSASCWGEDDYVRVDAARDWILSHAGTSAADRRSCGGIDEVGRCFEEVAVWCARLEAGAARIQADACQAPRRCGWNSDWGGFRCVLPEADRCAGIDDLGTCRTGEAMRCVNGQVRRNACSACGAECRRSAQTGMVACVLPD